MSFLQRLIAPEPEGRFASAEEADMADCGAGNIQRQLVKMVLASEYHNVNMPVQATQCASLAGVSRA